jgi:DNA-binding PadR family transcriptional regulator
MSERGRSNPLALAVLSCLHEKPMHPYEVAQTLRVREKHESIKLNYGSLYTVVESLQRQGLIVPQETQREGRRPERTVYALSEIGRVMLVDWLSQLLSVPVKEYTQFEAALSLMALLEPDEVVVLLEERCRSLAFEIRQIQAKREFAAEAGIPRVFTVENEYWLALREAELAWVSALVREIADGSLEGLAEWRGFHASNLGDDQREEGASGTTSTPTPTPSSTSS